MGDLDDDVDIDDLLATAKALPVPGGAAPPKWVSPPKVPSSSSLFADDEAPRPDTPAPGAARAAPTRPVVEPIAPKAAAEPAADPTKAAFFATADDDDDPDEF